MWLTSKMPAPPRTASCSSLTLVYCWGISQPAKSTRRAPAARCCGCSGVRLPAIRPVSVLEERVHVDVARLQVLEDLLVVPALGLGHHQADLLGARHRPLQLRGKLRAGRDSTQLATRVELGLHVVLRRLQQQPAVLDGLRLRSEGLLHVDRHLLARERLEAGSVAGGERPDRLDQAD